MGIFMTVLLLALDFRPSTSPTLAQWHSLVEPAQVTYSTILYVL